MDIQRDIFLRHATEATIEQITSEYQQKGYKVINDPDVDGVQADLMAVKERDVIVFEVKAGEWSEEKRQAVKQMRNKAVHNLGAKFKVVLVNLPKTPDIYVEGLESLFTELLPERYADAFAQLATHVAIEEVADIEITDLSAKSNEIEVRGTASVTLNLQYGSNDDVENDVGLRVAESMPLYFHVLLDNNLQPKEVRELELEGLGDMA
jgi:hypothetical protein